MPPIVINPTSGSTISGSSYTFQWTDKHGIHPAVNPIAWQLYVGTTQNGNDVCDSGVVPNAQLSNSCNRPASLPPNATCWTKIKYQKSDGSWWSSTPFSFTWT